MATPTSPKSSANRGGGNAASSEAGPPARAWTAEEMAGARPLPMPGEEDVPPPDAAPAVARRPPSPGSAAHVGSGRSVPGGPPDVPDADTR